MFSEEQEQECRCRMTRHTDGLFNGFLSGPLEDTFVCYKHGRYHYCNGESDCHYNAKGECYYSGYKIKLEALYRRDNAVNIKNAAEYQIAQLKNPYSFRESVLDHTVTVHGDTVTREMLTTPQMERVLAALYHFFSHLIDSISDKPVNKRVKMVQSMFLDMCDRVAEASVNNHEAKQAILMRRSGSTKTNKQSRAVIAKVISSTLEGEIIKDLEPIVDYGE